MIDKIFLLPYVQVQEKYFLEIVSFADCTRRIDYLWNEKHAIKKSYYDSASISDCINPGTLGP